MKASRRRAGTISAGLACDSCLASIA